jgi:23S rRNA (cytidine2498-2'-O)-methyltransferase
MPHAVPTPRFVFVLSQPHVKDWLKADFARNHPELSLAFSRPGLLTFKSQRTEILKDFVPKSVFVRHYGFSLGNVLNINEIGPLLLVFTSRLRLHVFARDEGESQPLASSEVLQPIRRELIAAFPNRFYDGENPEPGDIVLDVVIPNGKKEAEPWFVGWHEHVAGRSLLPGSVARAPQPSHAPSRAWSKLEEVIAWASLPVKAGQCAVEIGCAPGGAVVNLLDRGLSVIGIDPGAIDPLVVEHAKKCSGTWTHLACPVGAVKREQLPKHVDWLLCDANLAPTVTIRYLAHWSKQLRPQLRGIVFTLKLNDDKMVEKLPALLTGCASLGFSSARGIQLPSHRREIAVVCTKRK